MSSYFILRLDTTPPVVTIDAPASVIPGIMVGVYVNANEDIAEYQDIYIIDNNGIRHNVVFQYQPENNRYHGELNFWGYPVGIATIYARLRDKVNNLSSLVSAVIQVGEPTVLNYIELSGIFTDEISLQGNFKTIENLFGQFIENVSLVGSFEEQKELYGQFTEEINKLGRW